MVSPIPNVDIGVDGKASTASLGGVLEIVTKNSGKGGKIRAAYFINMDFDKMLLAAQKDPGEYNVTINNCAHFVERVTLAGNDRVDQPTIVNFVPVNFVDEYIEEGNAEVLFDPESNKITVGPADESDAKE